MTKFVRLMAIGFATSLLASATAKSEVTNLSERFVWEYSQFNDETDEGRATSSIALRIPETDATAIHAICAAHSNANSSRFQISGNTTDRQDREEATVTFYNNGSELTREGRVIGTKAEYGISGVELMIENEDPLWDSLSKWYPIGFRLLGEDVQVTSPGAVENIEKFLKDCRLYAQDQAQQLSDEFTWVTGLNVTRVYFKHGGHMDVGKDKWQEFDADRNPSFEFTEQSRDQWSVYLRDDSRGVNLQLDFYYNIVAYTDDNGQKFDIYDIHDAFIDRY